MSQVLKSSDLFISSYFEQESSSNPLLNKITHSNLVRLICKLLGLLILVIYIVKPELTILPIHKSMIFYYKWIVYVMNKLQIILFTSYEPISKLISNLYKYICRQVHI